MKFANVSILLFNWIMKISSLKVREKLLEKYLVKSSTKRSPKSTDINVLLNRVRINQKIESRKKLIFSALASTGLILFGIIIF